MTPIKNYPPLSPSPVLRTPSPLTESHCFAPWQWIAPLEEPIMQVTAPSGPGAPTAVDPVSQLGFTPLTSDASFNSTGLPCAYNSGTCPNNGFIYYFHDSRPAGQTGWAALSISPAGRLKKWYWNGSTWNN